MSPSVLNLAEDCEVFHTFLILTGSGGGQLFLLGASINLFLQGEVEQISMMKPKALTPHETGLLEYMEDIIGTDKYVEEIEAGGKRYCSPMTPPCHLQISHSRTLVRKRVRLNQTPAFALCLTGFQKKKLGYMKQSKSSAWNIRLLCPFFALRMLMRGKSFTYDIEEVPLASYQRVLSSHIDAPEDTHICNMDRGH